MPRYPSLYQVNTRVWLTEFSRRSGKPATLDDIPDGELDRIAAWGFDWVWMLSVWTTGAAGRAVSRSRPEWRNEFQGILPDLTDDDIPGSGFAITAYEVPAHLGGNQALARLRNRLQTRGVRLMLDFVPNHTGLDHPWADEHPEYFIAGSEIDLARAPRNFTWVKRRTGDRLLAHGRDPYFPGWPDTLQLDYSNPHTQTAMMGELLKIAGQCDALRCDMAMLVLPEVFERTWQRSAQPFWPEAIGRVRRQFPDFLFMAEVYWDLEWTLQQLGFDYTYDKRLYDRLLERHARPVREHLLADLSFQDKLARFLENHDEPRAAATFPPKVHEAAAVISFLAPGLRFFHQGQFQGKKVRVPPHLGRAPEEPVDRELVSFYDRLLSVLKSAALRNGRWRLLNCVPAWDGNPTSDCFVAYLWEDAEGGRIVVVVNFADHPSQCYVRLPGSDLAASKQTWRLVDQLGPAVFDRDRDDLLARGLYLDMGAWDYHAFLID